MPGVRSADVRFGSLADICAAKSDVGFTPNSDRESGFPQKSCLLYPLKQTDAVQNQMSAKGQKQTSSAQALWGILAVLRLERNRYDARLRNAALKSEGGCND